MQHANGKAQVGTSRACSVLHVWRSGSHTLAAHKQTPTPRTPVAVNVVRSFLDLVSGTAKLTNMTITYKEAARSVAMQRPFFSSYEFSSSHMLRFATQHSRLVEIC